MAVIKNIVGPKVREYRTKRGLTQKDLSAQLELAGLYEMSRIVVSKIEAQIRCINDYEIVVLAKVLGINPNELFPSYENLAQNFRNERISPKRAKRVKID